MPLIQSNTEQAFKTNIATEVNAGKDPKQAAAIAYEIESANSGDAMAVVPESVTLASINAENMRLYSTGVTD